MTIKLYSQDIVISEIVSTFVRHRFPNYHIVTIESQECFVPEEGFYPSVRICHQNMGGEPDTVLDLFLAVWIGNLVHVNYQDEYIDIHHTTTGALAILPNPVPAT